MHLLAGPSNTFKSWSDMSLTNTYSFSISDADIDPTPAWLPSAGQPPLLPADALRLAKDYLAKLVPDSDVWTVDSIQLDHWADSKHWLYVVLFKSPHETDNQTGFDLQRQMHIPVLMSGVVVKPKITPHPPFTIISSKPGSTNIELQKLPASSGH